MEYIRNTINILKYNIKALLIFETISKILISLVFIPIAIYGFNLTMKLTGYTYLTLENINSFAIKPLTIFFIMIIILFLTIVALFDISVMLIIYDASYHRRKIKMIGGIKLAIEHIIPLLNPKNIPVAFLLLFLIPFLNIGVSSNVISSISIPEFILDYIYKSNTLSTLLFTIYVVLFSMLINWVFSIHYMVLEGDSFHDARRHSSRLIRKCQIKDVITIIITQALSSVIYVAFIAFGLFCIYAINLIMRKHLIIESFFITIVGVFIGAALIIYTIFSTATNYAVISGLFYKHKKEKKECIVKIDYSEVEASNGIKIAIKRWITYVSILAILGETVLTYQIISGKANINIEQIRTMEITAHRGASSKYPENTMAAFRGAKELGADWIELDVQQTKDGQVVVCHDANLMRVAGINKKIIDMNYNELSQIDVGSHFDSKYKDERIPLLDDVIKFAKLNNIRLNIEIKPNGREMDFETKTINIIKSNGFEDMCVVTSQTYSVLKNIKEIDSNIKTVYVMSIAIGKITDLEYADCYSVEETNVTPNLVNIVHNEGKEIYVWTINTEESIGKMVDMNVDNIITDEILLGKKIVAKKKQGSMVIEFIDALQTFLKIE
ncbi:MAG: glycerophosphoryl diester phosphodiesterase membrane domain-containing protein [Clostridia bacterium]|nr:glycerophosphoryl diester phosphodiesterase membrane domain-containing protein [Clostridia bacterium]